MSNYRIKTYVAFDADNDIRYYRLMQAWKSNNNTTFNFYDAHDLNNLRPFSNEQTVKRKLSERLINAKLFILLVGSNTKYLYKFVRWEIEQAIKKNKPIIVVNINGLRYIDNSLCPSILANELAIHISFNQKIVEYAILHWEKQSSALMNSGKNGPFFYTKQVYEELGL
ncbi:MAG: TIR domain-containing protein [Candidatus Stygibacter australis]|nr:TIR domain-containing protein [Candidatus Stygibacter australis]